MKWKGGSGGWREKPSSSDLASLVKCELELVWTKDGKRPTAEVRLRESASREGEVLHQRTQVAMETFHNRPRPVRQAEGVGSSGRDKRCFVASAVYGVTAPETDELRAFRDRELVTWPGGRLLIRAYYVLSPSLVRVMGRTPTLARLARSVLDRVRVWLSRRRGGGGPPVSGDGVRESPPPW